MAFFMATGESRSLIGRSIAYLTGYDQGPPRRWGQVSVFQSLSKLGELV